MINLEVPESAKNKDWYKKITLAYSLNYNRPIPFNNKFMTPVDVINRNWLYVYGEQDIGKLNFAVQGTALQALTTKHNQIFTLVNSLHGKMVEFITNFKPYTELLSRSARSRKETLMNEILFAIDNRDFVLAMQQLGFYYNPIPDGVQLRTREEAEEYMETTWREFGAIIAERIADMVLKTSDYANLKPTQFLELLVAGLTSEDRDFENGIITEKKILPQAIIADFRNPNSNNFNDGAQFRGYFINMSSPYEIIEKESQYLEKEAIEQIRQCAESTAAGYGQWYVNNVVASPTGNFSYYQMSNYIPLNPVTSMSGIRMYFRAKVDYRYYNGKGGYVSKYRDYDNNGISIKENQQKTGIVSNWRWHYADLWGGQWVGKHGIVSNAFYRDANIGYEECPQSLYVDGFNNGFYKSRVSRLIDYQDDINLADAKIKQAEIKDIGYNVLISEMGPESDPGLVQRIYSEFKTQGMSTIKRDVDADVNMPTRFSEEFDFSKGLNVVDLYLKIKANCIQDMNNMMHMPDVAQGLQKSTIGKGVQATTVDLAETGLAPLFTGFINYIQKGLQLTVNKNKLSLVADNGNEDYARTILGDRGYEWLKQAVFTDFERIGVYIYPYDQMNQKNQARLEQDIIMALQGGLIKFSEAQKLKTFTSFREATNYLYKITKQAEAKIDAQREQDRMDALMLAQAEQESAIAGKQITADAAVTSAKERADATKHQADVKSQTDKEDTRLKLVADSVKGNK